MTPFGVLDEFCRLRVLVLGDAMLDSYLIGHSNRLCQEAPVPVVALHERRDHPGGAANTAANLAALGCQVELLALVGDDAEGARVRSLLGQHGVGTDLVLTEPGRRTLAKYRVLAGDRLVVRFDQGDTRPAGADVERRLLDRLAARFHAVDAVVVSDYSYGVLTPAVVGRLGQLQARAERLIAVDARDLAAYRRAGVTVVKPNYAEAVRLADESVPIRAASRADTALAIGETILERTGARIAAITLDLDGAVVVQRGHASYRTYAEPADQQRAAGAGDTYIGALALALAAGASTPLAAEIAAAAAGVVVSREGTAACTVADLRALPWPALMPSARETALVPRGVALTPSAPLSRAQGAGRTIPAVPPSPSQWGGGRGVGLPEPDSETSPAQTSPNHVGWGVSR